MMNWEDKGWIGFVLFNDTSPGLSKDIWVSCMIILFLNLRITRSDIRPHIKWEVSLVIAYGHFNLPQGFAWVCSEGIVLVFKLSWADVIVIWSWKILVRSLGIVNYIVHSKFANHQIRYNVLVQWAVSLVICHFSPMTGFCGYVWINPYSAEFLKIY